jgi:DNA-binding CsgD family transcriptional regulator/tetratricopeptide (TPR) repeat protein
LESDGFIGVRQLDGDNCTCRPQRSIFVPAMDDEHFVEHLLEEIDFALDQGRWDTVEELATKILSIDPDNPDALALNRAAQRRSKVQTTTRPSEADVTEQTQPKELSPDSFIGRDEELTHLKRTLERVVAEHGQMDMIVGEPGIGKSRLSEELSTFGRESGVRVLYGRCYEEGGAPPYWPWAQAVRAYLSETQTQELVSVLGPRASLVAVIFPAINELIPDLEPFDPGQQDPEGVRFRLFDAAASFLIDISNASPTLIVVDDLHWADESSLKLLVFLARELERSHLYILGTYRDVDLDRKHPLSDALGDLARERLFGRHPLRGFALTEVRSYIHTVSGADPPERLVRNILQLTNGNPLFVSQMAQLLAQDEKYQSFYKEGLAENEIRLPEGVREVIGKRLNHLSKECNEVLMTAAVLGLEFRLRALILSMGDGSEDIVMNALDEAERAHFIEPVPNNAGAYQFTHALVRQTLANELSLSRGVKLHARITQALEELYGENADAHAEELAEHAEQAETVLGPDRLVRYTQIAGERAADKHAYEEALRHFERGLVALEDSPLEGRKAALLYGKGVAQKNMLMYEEARKSFNLAMDYYEKTGDVKHVTSIAVAPLRWHSDLSLSERALKVIPADSQEMGEVLSYYGRRLLMRGQNQEFATEQFENALRIAALHRSNNLKAQVHSLWAYAAWYQLRTDACLDHSLQAIELYRGSPDPTPEHTAYETLIEVLRTEGKMAEAHQQLKSMYRIASESGDRWQLVASHRERARLAAQVGDWATARTCYDAILLSFELYGVYYSRACLEYETGCAEVGRHFMDKFTDYVRNGRRFPTMVYSFWPLMIARVSRISGETRDFELADEWGRRALELSDQTPPLGVKTARVAIGLLALLKSDLLAAEEQFDLLIDDADGGSGTTPLYAQHEPYGEFFGLFKRAVGELDESVGHFKKTLAVCRHSPPRFAWLNYELAITLLERLQKGDIEAARGLLEEALKIAVKLGMPPLEKRVCESLTHVSPAGGDAYPDNLTQREIEVIHQLVVGKTDQQIADTLFISIKTVSNHVSSILRKTRTGNRTEAANYATKHGLAED